MAKLRARLGGPNSGWIWSRCWYGSPSQFGCCAPSPQRLPMLASPSHCARWNGVARGQAPSSLLPLEDLVPLVPRMIKCDHGYGLAVSPSLGVMVTSGSTTLFVWGPPPDDVTRAWASAGAGAGVSDASVGGGGGGGGELSLVCTLGGAGSVAPMQFQFVSDGHSSAGCLAFIPPTTATTIGISSDSAHPLLLVADAGHDAVHVVDVVDRTHAGYLASPGSIAGPRGVAASGASPLVAVSAWKMGFSGDHVVVVYRGSGAVWEAVRVIGGGFGGPGSRDGQLWTPYGLRFSGDGSGICVADSRNNRASLFRLADGGFVRHIATGLVGAVDVEEVEGGWLVASDGFSHTVEFVSNGVGGVGGRPARLYLDSGHPTALAVVPGLGLVVRTAGGRGGLQVFSPPNSVNAPREWAWMQLANNSTMASSGSSWDRSSSHQMANFEDSDDMFQIEGPLVLLEVKHGTPEQGVGLNPTLCASPALLPPALSPPTPHLCGTLPFPLRACRHFVVMRMAPVSGGPVRRWGHVGLRLPTTPPPGPARGQAGTSAAGAPMVGTHWLFGSSVGSSVPCSTWALVASSPL
jgi:hypothetical protein